MSQPTFTVIPPLNYKPLPTPQYLEETERVRDFCIDIGMTDDETFNILIDPKLVRLMLGIDEMMQTTMTRERSRKAIDNTRTALANS